MMFLFGVWLILGGMFSLVFFGGAEWQQWWQPWFIGIWVVSLFASFTGPLNRWLERRLASGEEERQRLWKRRSQY